MILITRTMRLSSLADRLREYVKLYPAYAFRYDPMIEKLEALDSIATSDVIEIMGNDHFIDTTCAFCNRDSGMVVRLGNVEMVDMDICPDCLEEARRLLA